MVLRIALVALVAAAALAAWAAGWLDRLEPELMVTFLRGTGAWGPAVFVFSFALLEGLGAPGFIFLLSSAVVWPEWAFFLNWAGAVGAGCVGFLFARYVARDWVAAHLPERVHRFDARLAKSGVRTVILYRLVLFLLAPSHWLLGLSRVRFGDMLIGTAIGFLPGVALWTFLGVNAFDWLEEQPPEMWLGVIAAVFVAALLWRLRARSRAATP